MAELNTVEQVMADEMRCGVEELGDERCIMPDWLAKARIIRCGDSKVVLAVDREELQGAVCEACAMANDCGRTPQEEDGCADQVIDAILAKLDLREIAETDDGDQWLGVVDHFEGFNREVAEIALVEPAATVPKGYRVEDIRAGDTIAILKPPPTSKEREE